MGGHHTKLKVKDTNDIVTNVVLDSNQNCISYSSAGQRIDVSGNGNIVTGVDQTIEMNVDKNCVANVTQNSGTQQKIANQIGQSVADKTMALAQWLDAGHTTVETSIDNTIKTNVTEKAIENCMSSLDARQFITVSGDTNVLSGIVQTEKLGYVGGCLMSSNQVANAAANVSNTVNQHSSYEASNPFAFIGDAIAAIGIAVALFIFIIVLVIAYEVVKKRPAKKRPAAPATPVTNVR